MPDNVNLSPAQLDALREVGNIGAGNAATSLSVMINKRIEMSVPKADILPFDEVTHYVGGPEELVVGIYLKVMGDIPGSILFVLPFESGRILVDMLMGVERDTDDGSFSEMDESALMEIGNILTASYLTALSELTNCTLKPSVPYFACDMAAAILSVILIQLGEAGDYALVIETEFRAEGNRNVKGHFFLIPDPDSLSIMLKAIGVN